MNEAIKVSYRQPDEGYSPALFGMEQARKVHVYHKSFPQYEPTPLAELSGLAAKLGVAGICVKDESKRFGLNAFKALGGSYCVGRYIAKRLGMELEDLPYQALTSPELRARLGTVTFLTATDGNHGRGIAWTAQQLGQKSIVYMPKGSAQERLQNIRALGAEACITEFNYDDTVRFAKEQAEKLGAVLVQDTSWEGYEEIPTWIMQGYTTIGYELQEQWKEPPTHIFLQAGVGSMAGAMAGFFADCCSETKPIITIVEPNKADCIFRTAEARDGALHTVGGNLDTIMAGLACGEPCTIAWDVLSRTAEWYASVPDYVSAKGMRILGNPLPGDPAVVSGESGAATLGFVAELLQNEQLYALRRQLKLDASARILCISTEGDTDRENYRRIVWDGLYPSC